MNNNQQIKINLMFDANVNAAKNNIQQLATLLQQIATPKTIMVNGGAIQQAAQAAQTLQLHLQKAINVNTGKLDLYRLNTSLKEANLSLQGLSSKLVASGVQGQQAFQRLATAIAQAGAPAAQLSSVVSGFLKTMGSAMMWSAAYGAIEAVTSTISEAVDYAKDLNKALNDIAIVSDLSARELDDFAVKASKAAKALNTTTTEYAKAALIFYQQGLSGKEVEERANVVTKLAQVTGESAQQVSDQLTAIWNNFDDGSKSLEYYADALTALGAATAASTDEITQGLEKFAAISETVGLSYEYATAALATVVDKTRQSADVVGTSFKTLFARIGDLKLGETLDDGVTLGKYSQALQAVGVNILNQNGELKEMDDILDELGPKWDSISKAQQVALAQTVAGVRQYTQFMSLMENYEDFKINVDIATNAEGTLTDQWKTWADSYEAAAKRVEQRKNELYEALLDDDFVIGLTDAFAGIIGAIGKLAEVMGGLGPMILALVGLFANKLIPVITSAATRFISNWSIMTGAAQKQAAATKQETAALIENMIATKQITGVQAIMLKHTRDLLLAKENLAKSIRHLSAAQKAEYAQRMEAVELLHSETQALIENNAAAEKQASTSKRRFGMFNTKAIGSTGRQAAASAQQDATRAQQRFTQMQQILGSVRNPSALPQPFFDRLRQNQEEARMTATRAQRIAQSQQNRSMTSRILGSAVLDSTDEGWASNAMRANFLNQKLGMTEINTSNVSGPVNVDFSIDNLEKIITMIPRIRTGMEETAQATHELEQIMARTGKTQPISEEDIATVDQMQTGFKKLATQLNLTETDIAEVNNLFGQILSGKGDYKTLDALKQKFVELGISCDLLDGDLGTLVGSMIETGAAAGLPRDELIKLATDFENGAMSAEELRLKIEQMQKSIEGLQAPSMSMGQAFSNLVGQAANLASSLQMAVSGIQMLNTAFDTSADPMTRFTSLISGLGMLIPVLSMALNTQTASMTAASLATLFDAKSKQNNAFATWLLKAANDAENITLATSLALTGVMLLVLIALSAAIIGLVVLIKAAVNAFHQEEIALEEANANLEKQRKLLEDIKSEYEDLKATIEDFTEAQNAIEKMVEGSQQWKEAIAEANNQAMQLLAAYPELARYMDNINGRIVISEDGLNAILEKQWLQVTQQQANALEAQVVANAAQRAKNEKDALVGKESVYYDYYTRKEIKDKNGNYQYKYFDSNGKEVGEQEVGVAFGGIHGDTNGASADLAYAIQNKTDIPNTNSEVGYNDDDSYTFTKTTTYSYRAIYDAVQRLFEQGDYNEYHEQLKQLTGSNEEVMNEIHNAVVSAQQLIESNNKLNESLVAAEFADNETYQASSYKEFINKMAAQEIKDPYTSVTEAKKYLLGLTDNSSAQKFIKGITDAGVYDEESFAEYLRIMYGEENIREGDNEVIGTNYRVDDMGGTSQVVKHKVGDKWEVIDDDLTNDQAIVNVANILRRQELESGIADWDQKAQDYYDAFEPVLEKRAGDTEDAYINRITDLAYQFEQGHIINLGELTKSEVEALKLSADSFNNITNANGQQFGEALKTAVGLYGEAVKEANLSATKAWVENREEREATELQSILEEAGLEAKAFEVYKKQFATYGASAEAVAKKVLKTSNAVTALAKAFEEQKDALSNTDKSSAEYIQAISSIQSTLTEQLGVDLGYDYVAEHIKEVEAAANGSAEAIQKLNIEAAKIKIANLGIDDTELKAGFDNLIAQVENQTITVGADLNSDAFMSNLNKMVQAGEISMDKVQDIFDSVGFVPEYEGTQSVPGPSTHMTMKFKNFPGMGNETTAEVDTTSMMEVPIIKGAKYVGGTNTTTPKSVSSSGGGSSSKPKSADDEIERYHKVDREIDRLSREYDKLSKARDRAWGPERLKYLDQEIAKTKELANMTKNKLTEAEANLVKDREKLLSFGGISLDPNTGEILNYQQAMEQALAQANANPDNEGLQESYENFKAAIEQYEETLTLVDDLKTSITDYVNQELDLQLEAIQYEVEYKIDMSDFNLKNIEFQLENLTDAIGDLAEKFVFLGKSIEESEKKASNAKTAIEQTLQTAGLSYDEVMNAAANGTLDQLLANTNLTETQINNLKTNIETMQSSVSDMQNYYDQYSDAIVASFEDMNKEFEKSIENISHLTSLVEGYRNMIDLVGKDALGLSDELLEKLSEAQYSMANNNITLVKEQLAMNKKSLETAGVELEKAKEEARKRGVSEEDLAKDSAVKELQEAYDQMLNKVREGELSLQEATTAALKARLKLFEDEVTTIMNRFEKAMSGKYGSFAMLQEAFDQQKELSDLYVDDYEKIYELSKLTRDITNSIDDTDSIRGKERLREIQEEINKLQESGAQMTKYEVEELRAKYDLRLAEIALEEAQNAKNTVRMSRMADGTWGYVYTADQDAIDSAMQKYEDTLYDYQNKMQEYTDDLQERLISIPQQFSEAVRAIYEDQTLNDEQRRIKIDETYAYYQDMYAHVLQQMGVVNEDAQLLYDQDWTRYSQMTGYKISANNLWVDNFGETIASTVTGLGTLEIAYSTFQTASDGMLDNLAKAYEGYRGDIKTTLDLALGDIQTFLGDKNTEGTLAYWLEQIKSENKTAADSAADMGTAHANAFKKAIEGLGTQLPTYQEKIKQWVDETNKASTAIGELMTAYQQLQEQKSQETPKTDDKPTGDNPGDVTLEQGDKGLGDGGGGSNMARGYSRVDLASSYDDDNWKLIDTSQMTATGLTYSDGAVKQYVDGKGNYYYVNTAQKSQDSDNKKRTIIGYKDQKLSQPMMDYELKDWSSKGYTVGKINNAVYALYNPLRSDNSAILYISKADAQYAKTELPFATVVKPNGQKAILSFDTGGYTGSWDSSGRLAMLHQKELVLNASDTANFLAATNILRDITKVIDLQAMTQSNALSSLAAASIGTAAQVIEQEVTIHAEFPNATNHSEIEEAFNTLLNRASQFANRKK